MKKIKKAKMLVIGLDGACWPLIKGWIEKGFLPNIKELRESGVWGDLKSSIPPITCPAWKCYSTGKNPGKLGVFWWEHLDLEKKKSIIPNSRSFDSKELWDYLNEYGIKTGIVGMPTTYPPKKIEGFMVSGGPGAPNTGFTYPPELENDLKKEFNYTPNPEYPGKIEDPSNRREVVIKAIEQVKSNFKIAKYLLEKEKPNFLQIVTYHINGPLQHYFYDSEPTKKAWILVDTYIGRLKDKFDYTLIFSDHGTSPMIKQFFINAWLKKEGYLICHKQAGEILAKIGLNRGAIIKLLEKYRLKGFFKKLGISKTIARQIPDSRGLFGEREGLAILKKVDWKKTKIVGLAQGPLYINKSVLSKEEQESLKKELIENLESFKDPETGINPIKKVYRKEEVYKGKYLENAPDLIALDSDPYHNKGGIGKNVIFRNSVWKGNNSRKGLFLISGDGIKKGKRLDAEIYDLAPTIMHMFNLSIPPDIDGKVLNEVFTNAKKMKVRYRRSRKDERERIRRAIQRLREK